MASKTIGVEGMSCDHCAQTIKNAVAELTGIRQVSVNLEDKKVSVDFDENRVGLDEISAKITQAGFELSK